MKLELFRYKHEPSSQGVIAIDGKFECYTLEDQRRPVKIKKETCIPVGEYEIKLRTEGTHHAEYSKKFPEFHIGMLHLQDVPNFQYILIHIGNTIVDTEGCILTGTTPGENKISESTKAYISLYKKVATALKKGERVTIKITEWH